MSDKQSNKIKIDVPIGYQLFEFSEEGVKNAYRYLKFLGASYYDIQLPEESNELKKIKDSIEELKEEVFQREKTLEKEELEQQTEQKEEKKVPTTYLCPKCDKRFKTKKTYKEHIEDCFSDKEENKEQKTENVSDKDIKQKILDYLSDNPKSRVGEIVKGIYGREDITSNDKKYNKINSTFKKLRGTGEIKTEQSTSKSDVNLYSLPEDKEEKTDKKKIPAHILKSKIKEYLRENPNSKIIEIIKGVTDEEIKSGGKRYNRVYSTIRRMRKNNIMEVRQNKDKSGVNGYFLKEEELVKNEFQEIERPIDVEKSHIQEVLERNKHHKQLMTTKEVSKEITGQEQGSLYRKVTQLLRKMRNNDEVYYESVKGKRGYKYGAKTVSDQDIEWEYKGIADYFHPIRNVVVKNIFQNYGRKRKREDLTIAFFRKYWKGRDTEITPKQAFERLATNKQLQKEISATLNDKELEFNYVNDGGYEKIEIDEV